MHETELTFAEIISGARIIPLTKGRFAFVDAEDFDHLNQWRWHFDGNYPARCVMLGGRRIKKFYLHHAILAIRRGEQVDHWNTNKCDSRRFNLRLATHGQNCSNKPARNASGMKGAYYDKRRRKWEASITVNRKKVHLGTHQTVELAHAAYCLAAIEFHGEFARMA